MIFFFRNALLFISLCLGKKITMCLQHSNRPKNKLRKIRKNPLKNSYLQSKIFSEGLNPERGDPAENIAQRIRNGPTTITVE